MSCKWSLLTAIFYCTVHIDKPLEPVNLTVQEIQRNDTECKLYNKITWEPPQDDGGILLTGYLLEFKHPVVNRISHSRININTTEHMVCKLQISGHPRELKVDVRGINKAGRGFRSNSIKVLFFSKFYDTIYYYLYTQYYYY